MVVIFSIEHDSSTHKVMDWLSNLSEDFCIVYPSNFSHKIIEIIDFVQQGNRPSFCFRKWDLKRYKDDYLNTESFRLIEYLYHLTKDNCFWLNNPYDYDTNSKLLQHHYAQKVGLNSPDVCLVNSRHNLQQLLERSDKQFITKSLGSQIFKRDKTGQSLFAFTMMIEQDVMDRIPNHFFPSLIQDYIDKEFEIRTFFLDGEFFSMAIFSQENEKTKIDFRHYDNEKPNRCEPICLPTEIEFKLSDFVTLMDTNCGSFDLIQDKSGEIFFIEFNPLGQFGMVSTPCNYMLEKRIAEKLKKHSMATSVLTIDKEKVVYDSDPICAQFLKPVSTSGVDACFYSSFYESDYGLVQNLYKPLDLIG
ncbi:MAG: hypothetical protein KA968_13145 [Chitinophagaceae bacterium]|nr:hypothetical protein [Chitinophagaceae bacterium]